MFLLELSTLTYEFPSFQTNENQIVTHLNYTGWPDHGTPSQPEQLLTFISYMRHVHQSGPIITHCSAGIGRSGTLICIDVVLGLISKDADVSIFHLRNLIITFFSITSNLLFFFLLVVWYFRRCQEHEASETRNGPNRGGLVLSLVAFTRLSSSQAFPYISLSFFSFPFSGAVYFLLSSDPLCPPMPSSRRKHLRIVETLNRVMWRLDDSLMKAKQKMRIAKLHYKFCFSFVFFIALIYLIAQE